MLLAATSDGALRINEAARSHDDPGTYPTAGGRLGSADARNAIAVGPTGDAR